MRRLFGLRHLETVGHLFISTSGHTGGHVSLDDMSSYQMNWRHKNWNYQKGEKETVRPDWAIFFFSLSQILLEK